VAASARPFASDTDLRAMQRLVQECWRLEGPKVLQHVGDLAWGATMHAGREAEWERRLWEQDGSVVAWAWLRRPAELDFQIHPDRRGDLRDAVLSWFEGAAEGDGPLETYALEDDSETLAALERRGYRRSASVAYPYHVRGLEELDEPRPAAGYRLRHVLGEDDLRERVEVHRAVWHPSRVTEESYRTVMATWPYRPELDCVAEASNGSFGAYTLVWYDDENRVGELEPVGTHPDHRRRGLASAVILDALRRLREAGAETAVVYAGGRDEDAPARALY
jgi:GNAT superfamily N-acetyltransferase